MNMLPAERQADNGLSRMGCGLCSLTGAVASGNTPKAFTTGTGLQGHHRGGHREDLQLHPAEPFRVRVLGVPSGAVSVQDGLGRARTVER